MVEAVTLLEINKFNFKIVVENAAVLEMAMK